jgi:hypothetical protein
MNYLRQEKPFAIMGPARWSASGKTGKCRRRVRNPGDGTHFAHPVTILLSGLGRIVGPGSVQSGQVVRL